MTVHTSTDRNRSASPDGAPGADWVNCPSCGWLLYRKRLARAQGVCPECDHHFRLSAPERIRQLLDAGSFEALNLAMPAPDPLGFEDLRPYRHRWDEARRAGADEAALAGTARIGGHPVVVAVMEFGFMGGSMGTAVGEIVTRAAEIALDRTDPLLLVCASGGARMQEGVLSLLQMVRTSQAIGRLHEAGVLSVCLLTDPTYGGVSASFATLGSVVLAESGANVGFAGPRVIEQTLRQKLPEGFQSAQALLERGLIDRVEHRSALRGALTRLLGMHARTSRVDPGQEEPAGLVTDPRALPAGDAWELVCASRDTRRPTTLDYLDAVFDDFVELHGDRAVGDDPAMVGGLARLGHRTVVVLGHQKGHGTAQLVARNFGMPHPEGYRKAIRLMTYAERFGFPVITLVDTPGAHPGADAEVRGQSQAIAETIMRSSRLRTPVVAVVTGEGGSGGALALSTADRLLTLENAFLSVISPEGCAAILWRDAGAAPKAAAALHLGAADLLRRGIADGVVREPAGGAQADQVTAMRSVRAALVETLRDLLASVPDPETLVALRYDRYRAVGAAEPPEEGPHDRGPRA